MADLVELPRRDLEEIRVSSIAISTRAESPVRVALVHQRQWPSHSHSILAMPAMLHGVHLEQLEVEYPRETLVSLVEIKLGQLVRRRDLPSHYSRAQQRFFPQDQQ